MASATIFRDSILADNDNKQFVDSQHSMKPLTRVRCSGLCGNSVHTIRNRALTRLISARIYDIINMLLTYTSNSDISLVRTAEVAGYQIDPV